eukprot:gnl/Hemi2/23031_TR7714_c0_g1_i1.p1 gnl/Hemi2/23031_TR7714_c0_g1~~gnl/Hemi2/23031_TR7714_c0_g1_i1.p1  ORF type:complete len:714 (+),score=255.99 gnl/Hemi2/23031_TR7714_c0_g1_i1:56-2197(+)
MSLSRASSRASFVAAAESTGASNGTTLRRDVSPRSYRTISPKTPRTRSSGGAGGTPDKQSHVAHSVAASGVSVSYRSISPDRFATFHEGEGSRMRTDVMRGTVCVKKRKVPGVYRLAVASGQVWCATEQGLRVLSSRALDLHHFGGEQVYHVLLGVQNRVFAGTASGAIHVFDTQTLTCISQVDGHEREVNAFCQSPEGVWSAGVDGLLKLWDVETGGFKRQHQGPSDMGEIFSLTCYGSEVWAGSENGHIYVFSSSNPDPHILAAHDRGVYSLCTFQDQVWSGSEDRTIAIFDADSKEMQKKVFKHNGRISALTVVGNRVWSGSYDSKVGVWHPREGDLVGVVPGVYSQIYDIVVVGVFVWVATRDETLRVFVSQGLVEGAQSDLCKYCLASVGELETLFTATMAENEQLCLLVRSLRGHMMRRDAWFPRNWLPSPIEYRTNGVAEFELLPLMDRLQDLEKRWTKERQEQLNNWDLPAMAAGLQSEMREFDPLAELRALLEEVQNGLAAECEDMQQRIAVEEGTWAELDTELQDLQTTLLAEHRKADDAMQAARSSMATQQRRVDTLQKQLEQNKLDISQLKQDKVTLDQTAKTLEQKTQQYGEDMKRSADARMQTEPQLNMRKRELAKHEEDVAAAKAELLQKQALTADLAAAINAKTQELKQLQADAEKANQERTAQDTRQKALTAKLAEKKNECATLKKELDKGKCIVM